MHYNAHIEETMFILETRSQLMDLTEVEASILNDCYDAFMNDWHEAGREAERKYQYEEYVKNASLDLLYENHDYNED
jgi:hypothetical protein